jgi:hypothetical protein
MAKIFLATPTHSGDVRVEWFHTIVATLMDLASHGHQMVIDTRAGESLVPRARNHQVHAFLQTDATHMWCFDSDQSCAGDVARTLVGLNLDVVGCLVPLKRRPIEFAVHEIGNKLETDGRGVAEVAAIGTGCMMVSRETIERMAAYYQDRWFYSSHHGTEGYRIPLLFDTWTREDRHYLSEDYGFCELWRGIGGRVHAYLPGRVTHHGWDRYEGDVSEVYQ